MALAILLNDDGTVTVPLTRGYVTILDRPDFERHFHPIEDAPTVRWCAVRYRSGHVYAYRKIRRDDGTYRSAHLHRDILDAPKGIDVDHINGDGLDNRRCNIRLATRTENNANRRLSTNTASRYKGVHWDRDTLSWRAQINCAGKRHHLGRFSSEDDAGLAYNFAAIRFFGEFALLNNLPLHHQAP